MGAHFLGEAGIPSGDDLRLGQSFVLKRAKTARCQAAQCGVPACIRRYLEIEAALTLHALRQLGRERLFQLRTHIERKEMKAGIRLSLANAAKEHR